MISIYIPGTPIGKGRARSTRKGVHYTPAKTRAWETAAAMFGKQAMRGQPPLQGPLSVDILAYMPIPESWSKVRQRSALDGHVRATGRPDVDNIAKAVGDSLNGVAWSDDAQIVSLSIAKLYSLEPQVVVHVYPR